MARSKRLRLRDVRAAMRLVGECRELGVDPVAWRTHLVEGAMRLVAARVGMCGEVVLADPTYTRPQVELGWEAGQGEICHAYWRERLGNGNVFWQRLHENGGFLRTVLPQQYVSDRQWYVGSDVQEFCRAADVDRLIMSGRMCSFGEPTLDRIALMRAWGEDHFSHRERRLIELLHDEIAPLIGRQLASRDQPTFADLSPRLRQTLACLLKGMSERQVAFRFGLSQATVHEYVQKLYAHYGVGSRSELLSSFIQAPPAIAAEASSPREHAAQIA